MELLLSALPTTPEQWVAALATLALAIIGFFRKRPPAPPNGQQH